MGQIRDNFRCYPMCDGKSFKHLNKVLVEYDLDWKQTCLISGQRMDQQLAKEEVERAVKHEPIASLNGKWDLDPAFGENSQLIEGECHVKS